MPSSQKLNMSHISVLLKETIDGLEIKSGDVVVDCTLGDAGHIKEAISRQANITAVGIDRDQNAIDRAQSTLGGSSDVVLRQGNFRDVGEILARAGIAEADKFIFDIGLSSRQLEESGRGFSFQKDEPLVMTFEKDGVDLVTARDVVNDWSEESLTQIIRGFGEEKFAKRIARGIVSARELKQIETSRELVEIILNSTPSAYHRGRVHPATRTFQAIRIAVNDELGSLTNGLKSAWSVLRPGGRIAVITFHSLEDRIVKQYFNNLKKEERGKVITKKPITASEEELNSNPRSRSAKLRIIEKI